MYKLKFGALFVFYWIPSLCYYLKFLGNLFFVVVVVQNYWQIKNKIKRVSHNLKWFYKESLFAHSIIFHFVDI